MNSHLEPKDFVARSYERHSKNIDSSDVEKIAMGLGLPYIAFKGYTRFPWITNPKKRNF